LIFPDDEAVQPHLKLLAMAKRWKKGQDDVSMQTNVKTNETNSMATPTEENTIQTEPCVDADKVNDES
jgi:hypothetical protein